MGRHTQKGNEIMEAHCYRQAFLRETCSRTMQLLDTISSKTLHNRALTRLDMRGHRVQLTISYMFGESMATQFAQQSNPVRY